MGGLARRWRLALGAVLAALLPYASAAQIFPNRNTELGPVYLDLDTSARIHLRRAEANLDDRRWAEGVDILGQVMQSYGDKLVELAEHRYVSVRTLCHLKIAALAPEGLQAYRDRVDGQAMRWYQQGRHQRREEPLRELVQRAFCSSWGDDALALLGEMALEQGRFWEARAYWEMILPADDPFLAPSRRIESADIPVPFLCYPDSDLDLIHVRARLVLCLLLGGDFGRAHDELELFRASYAKAEGYLAGRKGPYAETLDALSHESRRWTEPPRDTDWPTFAGNARRNQALPFTVEVGAKVGAIPLRTLRRARARPARFQRSPRVAEDRSRPLSYFPALVGGKLIVNNAGDLMAFDPATCKSVWPSSDKSDNATVALTAAAARYTLTVEGDRAYARVDGPISAAARHRLGQQRFRGAGRFMRGGFATLGGQGQTSLSCWNLAKEGQELWTISPPEPDLAFEGSPVVQGGRLYVALRRGGNSAEAFVACYDDVQIVRSTAGIDELQPPEPQLRWMRFVCQAATVFNEAAGGSHNLLTYAHGRIFYCTNLGAVVALDAGSGTIEWAFTYQRSSPRSVRGLSDHFARNLNPCLVHQGTVVAAPADTPEVFALDAATGRLRWRSELLPDAVHLLGVGHGNLIASGRRLYFVDVTNGKVRHRFPHSNDVQAQGYGRGILSGRRVYWPMRDEIRIFDQATGRLQRRILLKVHNETAGNLLVADGFLVVAKPDQLVVYSQFSRLFDQYRDAVVQKPDDALRHYRLGRAAEATRRWDLASSSYHTAAKLAKPDELVENQPLAEQAHLRLHHLLSLRAADAAQSADWELAVDRYAQAAELPVPPKLRLEAVFQQAQTWQTAGHPGQAVRSFQALLADPELADAPLSLSKRLEVPARRVVQQKVLRMIDHHGPELYAEFGQQAADALQAALAADDSAAVETLLDRYPAAIHLRDTLQLQAERYLREDRPYDAARLYQRLMPLQGDPVAQSPLYDRLAAAYEADGYLPLADHVDAPNGVVVQAALQQPGAEARRALRARPEPTPASYRAPLRAAFQHPPPPNAQLPLLRQSDRTLPQSAQVIQPAGNRPTVEPRWVFFAVPDGLQCWSLHPLISLWRIHTDQPVQWLGYAGDALLVATEANVALVDLSDGGLHWRHWLRDPEHDPGTAFASARKTPHAPPRFLLDGNRLYCREADRLVALDVHSGNQRWSYTAAGEEQLVAVLPDGTLVVHAVADQRLVSIDPDTGRDGRDVAVAPGPWGRAARHLGNARIAVIPNRQTVELYDVKEAKRILRFQEVSPLGWPDVFGDGHRLLLVLLGRHELIRLDPQNGEELWRYNLGRDRLGSRQHLASELAYTDGETFYYAAGGMLVAVDLMDGSPRWRRYVGQSGGQWRIVPAGRYVAAHLVEPGTTVGGGGNDQQPPWPVVFCNRQSGALVEQWNFDGSPRGARVVLGSRRAAVVNGPHLWSFGTLEPLSVVDKGTGP